MSCMSLKWDSEVCLDAVEFGVHSRHGLVRAMPSAPFWSAEWSRVVFLGDDIFTLSVRQPLTKEDLLTVLGIAREAHASGRGVAHIPEHHRLDVHGGARVVRDALRLSVVACSRCVEATKHRIDGQAQAGPLDAQGTMPCPSAMTSLSALTKPLSSSTSSQTLHDPFEAGPRPERIGVVNAQDHIAEHGDEAAVGVPGEAWVSTLGGQALDGGVVQPS